MSAAMVGTEVRVLKGQAEGCHGVVRVAVWLPSGSHMFGIELDEPKGLNDGRFKVRVYLLSTHPTVRRFLTPCGYEF